MIHRKRAFSLLNAFFTPGFEKSNPGLFNMGPRTWHINGQFWVFVDTTYILPIYVVYISYYKNRVGILPNLFGITCDSEKIARILDLSRIHCSGVKRDSFALDLRFPSRKTRRKRRNRFGQAQTD